VACTFGGEFGHVRSVVRAGQALWASGGVSEMASEAHGDDPHVHRLVTGIHPVPDPSSTRVIVLAGGRGRRLAPYTSVLPKPLMPIGDRSILEILVEQLADAGLTDLTFCVGYLSHLIRAVFDNGPGKRVNIRHVKEETPLGTAGPLRLVEGLDSTFLVMNGDLLTDLSFNRLLQSHRASGNVVTIATHVRILKSDYGVLHLDDGGEDVLTVTAYEEKPELSLNVSMGIYAMEPEALNYIDPHGHFDFPDLVQALLADGRPVGAFSHDGLWLDIGRHEDYERAIEIWHESTSGDTSE
jgi:NDP-mannose synthase